MAVCTPHGTVVVVAPECFSGQRLLEAARAAGYRTVAAVAVPPQQDANIRWHLVCRPERPGACDRLVWCATYEELRRELAPETGIAAVIPGSEFGVPVAERLAHDLGVRGNPIATSRCRRDKYAMKEAIAAAGLRTAPGAFVTTLDAAREAVRTACAYPVVVKPPDGAAALNVFTCADDAELARAFARVSETPDGYGKVPHGAVVEAFVAGDEYAVNLFGDGDRIVVTSLWRYEWNATPFAERLYWNEYLQDPDDPAFADLLAYARRLYRAVGIRLGPAHAEIKLTDAGPVALEIGARLSGGSHETVTDAGMCLNVPAETVKVFATGRSDLPDRPKLKSRLAYVTLPYVTSGRVTAVRGLETIRALPTFLRAEMPVNVGDAIRPSTYSDECACGVWLKGETERALAHDARIVHEVFRIETV